MQSDLNLLWSMAWPKTGDPRLVVDGVFGPNTLKWLRQFQQAAGIEPDGCCGPVTWSMLTMHRAGAKPEPAAEAPAVPKPPAPPPKRRRQRLAYLHDGDIYDAGKTFGRHRSREADVVHVEIPSGTAIGDSLRRVRQAVGDDALELLIMNAHGNQGSLYIGEWIKGASFPAFATLRPLFDRAEVERGIEIHSCCFASAKKVGRREYSAAREWLMGHVDEFESGLHTLSGGTFGDSKDWRDEDVRTHWTQAEQVVGDGTAAMVKLAKQAGCLVKAAFSWQRGDAQGRFEDLWACARPDGRVTLHPDTVPPSAIQR